jgi:hypothetical protein
MAPLHRHRPIPISRLLLSCLALSPVLAACGGSTKASSRVSPAAYVSQVCTSVGTWLHSVEGGSTEIDRELKPGATPAAAKRALEGLIEATIASSERAVAGLRAAGIPDVAQGKELSTQLLDAFERATRELSAAKQSVRTLPTTSASAFRSSAKTLAESLRSSMAGIGAGLSDLHSAALEHAAGSSLACRTLGASAG